MQYKENPVALLLIPLAIILGGGAVAAAVVAKKKKAPTDVPTEPSYPYAPQPGLAPSVPPSGKADPAAQMKQFQEKYGSMLPSAASAAKKAYEMFTSPPSTPDKINEAAKKTAEQEAAIEKVNVEIKSTGKLPKGEDIPGPEAMPADSEATPQSPAQPSVKTAATGVSAAATGAKILGVGLGTVALIGVGVAVVVAGFEAFRSQQKQLKKTHDDYKLWRAMAVQYVKQKTEVGKNTAAIQSEIDFMQQAIPKMRAALA